MNVNIIKITKSAFKPGMVVCPIDDVETMEDAVNAYLSGKVAYSWLLYRSPVDQHVYCSCDGEEKFGIYATRETGFFHDHWFNTGHYAVIMKDDVSEENADQECVKIKAAHL